jgi:hypothetical protein
MAHVNARRGNPCFTETYIVDHSTGRRDVLSRDSGDSLGDESQMHFVRFLWHPDSKRVLAIWRFGLGGEFYRAYEARRGATPAHGIDLGAWAAGAFLLALSGAGATDQEELSSLARRLDMSCEPRLCLGACCRVPPGCALGDVYPMDELPPDGRPVAVQPVRGASPSPERITVGTVWTDARLLIAANVRDTEPTAPRDGNRLWTGDSLWVSFGPYDAGGVLRYNWAQRTFALALTQDGPRAYQCSGQDGQGRPLPGSFAQAEFTIQRRQETALRPLGGGLPQPTELSVTEPRRWRAPDELQWHTVYRIAIPWELLGRTGPPTVGSAVAFALTLNSVDRKGTRRFTWFADVLKSPTPTQMGQLMFVGGR